MKLQLGQAVHTTDGVFGELGDIVIEPLVRDVTHIVVQPHHHHSDARLVPIELARVVDNTVYLDLDNAWLQQLPLVADTEFIRPAKPIEVGGEWTVGTEDFVPMPYLGGLYGDLTFTDNVEVRFDRIPIGECEIRRRSEVRTSDGLLAGHVEGFVTDQRHLTEVVVVSGLPGFRHHRSVLVNSVGDVATDHIVLTLDHEAFERLPLDEELSDRDAKTTLTTDTDHRAADHRAADHRAGDHRAADHRAGDHRAGDHRAGDHRAGDHRASDIVHRVGSTIGRLAERAKHLVTHDRSGS